jgi:hypothetical protein
MAYVDERSTVVDASPQRAWDTVVHLGGDERFYAPRELWRTRGRLERLVGGPGHRISGPGRALVVGDEMDFWEVVEVHAPRRLRLRALSLLPGTAYLDVEVQARTRAQGGGTRLTLRTTFEPAGLPGHLFWWAELPAHKVVFALMVRRLASMVADG